VRNCHLQKVLKIDMFRPNRGWNAEDLFDKHMAQEGDSGFKAMRHGETIGHEEKLLSQLSPEVNCSQAVA
jgi:hypothetical protein